MVVIEAARVSGSLITARWAVDQGRAVFALPGRVDHPMAHGCHRLLREGAALVESPRELLQELGLAPDAGDGGSGTGDGRQGGQARAPRSPLLKALRGETLTADELSERLGRPVGEVLTELVQRELSGELARSPGGLYRLCSVS